MSLKLCADKKKKHCADKKKKHQNLDVLTFSIEKTSCNLVGAYFFFFIT